MNKSVASRKSMAGGGRERKSVHDGHVGEKITTLARNAAVHGLPGIVAEYKSICQQDQEKPATAFEANKALNRWADIKCFDDTRVVLNADGLPNMYIHANYIDGYERAKKYIATQGPMTNTVADFWRMIWQENVLVVAALSKIGGGKCELYFPEASYTKATYGQITVENKGARAILGYDAIALNVTRGKEKPRRICLFVYFDWPDKGSPKNASSVMRFIDQINYNHEKMMKKQTEKKRSPIVVHCSAGVGRTGTLIVLDIICKQLADTARNPKADEIDKTPSLDLKGTVVRMRAQRAKMVQKVDQYTFLYLAIVEYALRMDYLVGSDIDVAGFLTSTRQSLHQEQDNEPQQPH